MASLEIFLLNAAEYKYNSVPWKWLMQFLFKKEKHTFIIRFQHTKEACEKMLFSREHWRWSRP